ncbi:MAG: plasmid mobilization relaxosome protein MobC [Acidobacteria bacterium]|nr:plasmid mobilization relaxosome protein MobC [Acidobacteriota bacterium]
MARPRIDTNARRSRQVSIRLTPAEARAIEAAVARAGRPPVAFIRSAALAAAGAASRLREPAIRQELRRIGANLNQALRLAHAGRDADLAAAVTAVRDVVARRLA